MEVVVRNFGSDISSTLPVSSFNPMLLINDSIPFEPRTITLLFSEKVICCQTSPIVAVLVNVNRPVKVGGGPAAVVPFHSKRAIPFWCKTAINELSALTAVSMMFESTEILCRAMGGGIFAARNGVTFSDWPSMTATTP